MSYDFEALIHRNYEGKNFSGKTTVQFDGYQFHVKNISTPFSIYLHELEFVVKKDNPKQVSLVQRGENSLSITVNSASFLKKLEEHCTDARAKAQIDEAKQLQNRGHGRTMTKVIIILAILGIIIAGFLIIPGMIINSIVESIPFELQNELGRATLTENFPQAREIEANTQYNKMLIEVVNSLWDSAKQIDPENQLFHHDLSIYIIDDQINAFAVPGNIIVFGSGLLSKFTSIEQLAAVTAHELIHVINSHGLKNVASSIGIQGGLLILTGGSSDLVRILTLQFGQLLSLSYSRDQEREADIMGTELLESSGFNPQGMVQLLELLLEMEEDGTIASAEYSILSNHDITEERIEIIEGQMDSTDSDTNNRNIRFIPYK